MHCWNVSLVSAGSCGVQRRNLFSASRTYCPIARSIKKSKKDKGQRKACGCVISKDIGMYNTCPHLCRYCYANSSEDVVLANHKRHNAACHESCLIPPNDTH